MAEVGTLLCKAPRATEAALFARDALPFGNNAAALSLHRLEDSNVIESAARLLASASEEGETLLTSYGV